MGKERKGSEGMATSGSVRGGGKNREGMDGEMRGNESE